MTKPIILFALCLLCLLVAACSSTEKVGTQGTLDPNAEWWNNPGAVRDHLASVGTGMFMGNLAQARNSAMADGRAQLAATLKTKIQQLVEDWAKSAGDLNIEKSVSAYVNNETFTRQFVDTYITGARPIKFHQQGNNVFCLMILEAGKAQAWLKEASDAVAAQALRDETLFKTEALKNQARDRLNKLIDKEKEKVKKSYEKITAPTS